jgi:opacity protein-like surface antigen
VRRCAWSLYDLIRKAFSLFAAALLAVAVSSASAQTDVPESAFDKQLDRIDLGVIGVGIFNSTVSGTVQAQRAPTDAGLPISQYGSNTFGAIITLRYIAKPYIGAEVNYGYARYTENYTGAGIAASVGSSLFQIQTKATEYTAGYVATPHYPVFGFQPFVSAGGGVTAFTPTPRGGEGEPEQARATYYYSLGLQQSYYNGHFGIRAGFRQAFYIDPDFGANYLTIVKHTSTKEPMIGFYLRY